MELLGCRRYLRCYPEQEGAQSCEIQETQSHFAEEPEEAEASAKWCEVLFVLDSHFGKSNMLTLL